MLIVECIEGFSTVKCVRFQTSELIPEDEMSQQLKRLLFNDYGGFADKRIKNLDKANSFIVDDRSDSDVGADKGLLSYFCLMFAVVESDNELKVRLYGNVPKGERVRRWLDVNDVEIQPGLDETLEFKVDPKTYGILDDLATAVASIVAPGAPRYTVSNYKYVCPRVAGSLRKLKRVLDKIWA